MANEVKRLDPPRNVANKRQADVEALAGNLFVPMLMAARGQKNADGVAKDAILAAREFFKVCDQSPEV